MGIVMIAERLFSLGVLIDGKFRVEEIRRGRLGIVYLCQNEESNKPVAIKTYGESFLDGEENHKLFLRESALWIQLGNHPNIVRAYALKMIEDKPHLLLERVIPNNTRGPTLKDYLFSAPIDQQEMLRLGICVCDGMIHAIQQIPDLVHRDLKPENLLIGQDLILKVSDFGMTMRRKESPDSVQINLWSEDENHPSFLARRLLGTPATASPEQCVGNPLDTRSDIYSFGCIMYQIATKRLPFYKATVEEYIVAQLSEEPLPPYKLNKSLSTSFSDLILRCLEKKAEHRFRRFQDVRERLSDLFYELTGKMPVALLAKNGFTLDEKIDRAVSFALLKDYSRAREELIRAERESPRNIRIPFELGKICLQQGRNREALSYFLRLLPVEHRNAEFFFLLGTAYWELGSKKEAWHSYQQTLLLRPVQPRPYLHIARLYANENLYREAEAALLTGMEVCNQKRDFVLRLAELYQLTQNPKAEYRIFEKAVKESGEEAIFFLRLAELSQEANDKRKTVSWTEKAAAQDLHRFQDWFRLGRLYKWLNETQKAVEAWEEAHKTGEGTAPFYLEAAELLQRIKRYQDAWSYLLQAEELGANVIKQKREIQTKMH